MKTESELYEWVNQTGDDVLDHHYSVQQFACAFEKLVAGSVLITNAEHAALQAELAEANKQIAELLAMTAELSALRELIAGVPVGAIKAGQERLLTVEKDLRSWGLHITMSMLERAESFKSNAAEIEAFLTKLATVQAQLATLSQATGAHKGDKA